MGLKDAAGYRIVDGERKTGFLGFLCCLESVRNIFNENVGALKYLVRTSAVLAPTYLLTYKLNYGFLNSSYLLCVQEEASTTTPVPCSSKLYASGCSCIPQCQSFRKLFDPG
ncbi:hypothetical protein PoB_004833700 [Plakobranchus ocellatus]|uniref:Uncharacterized protein n=1 Tax=Plakobranchus ocellatus TaxID=259542 RepID=A0AAV4BR39_9GAST|nr:hypothetical protein PoB_004833700 [Plakobranchus ocellatus]